MPNPPFAQELSDKDFELKTKRLYAEQSYIARRMHQDFIDNLQDLSYLLKTQIISGKPVPRCQIIYAPTTLTQMEAEYWVEPFLYLLCEHLKSAGIHATIDFKALKFVTNPILYAKQLEQSPNILLIGNKSLGERHYSLEPHIIKTAIAVLPNLPQENHQILPLLLNGTKETAFPDDLAFTLPIINAHSGYVVTIKHVIDWIFREQISSIKEVYESIWQSILENRKLLEFDIESVNYEINLGYHRRSLLDLELDYKQYSLGTLVEIETKTEDSQPPATVTEGESLEIMSILAKSQGSVTHCYDNHGINFQRPDKDAYFIKRPALFESMKKHFSKERAPILVLTGLKGIGKTAMSKEYFLNPVKPYSFRAWFHLEKGIKDLEEQYHQLAMEQGIQIPSDYSPKQKINCIKTWIGKQSPALLIYDGVMDIELLEFLPISEKKQDVIISSNTVLHWLPEQRFHSLAVPFMEEQEAMQLVYLITQFSNKFDAEVRQLIKTLKALPATLVDAANVMVRRGVNPPNYLRRFGGEPIADMPDVLAEISSKFSVPEEKGAPTSAPETKLSASSLISKKAKTVTSFQKPDTATAAFSKYNLPPKERALYTTLLDNNRCFKISQKEGFILESNTTLPYSDADLIKFGLQLAQCVRDNKATLDKFVYVRPLSSCSASISQENSAVSVKPSSNVNTYESSLPHLASPLQNPLSPSHVMDGLRKLQQEAEECLEKRHYKNATDKYQQLIFEHDKNLQDYKKSNQERSHLLFNLSSDFKQIKTSLEHTLAMAYFGLGLSYFKSELFDLSYLNLIKALELHPEHLEYQKTLVECNSEIERHSETTLTIKTTPGFS
ncbi:MAG: hypothetical protein H0U75_08345 [Legionella sp.]|nr:hypothetical protein [Legionella sp.]